MKTTLLAGFCFVIGVASASAASLYVGDVASAGLAVPAGTIGPDGANGGDITYGFFSPDDTYSGRISAENTASTSDLT